MLRRVQGERSVGLTFGQRALMIGALDPRNFIGTLARSRYRDEPFKRLAATGRMFETVFFGTRADADRVLTAVDRMHSRVEGELGEQAGPFGPGTRYSAFDPELMLWTIGVAAESAATFYRLLVGPLTEDELDAFWADWVRFGVLFGMDPGIAPRGWREFTDWYEGRLASDEMHLTREARITGIGVAFRIPVPTVQGPAMELHNLILLGSLPERVRELYGLRWSSYQQGAWLAATRGIRAARTLSPPLIARGKSAGQYANVARVEARRIREGRAPIRLAA